MSKKLKVDEVVRGFKARGAKELPDNPKVLIFPANFNTGIHSWGKMDFLKKYGYRFYKEEGKSVRSL